MAYGTSFGMDANAATSASNASRSLRDVASELVSAAEGLEERLGRLMDRIEGPSPKGLPPTPPKSDGPGALASLLSRLGVVVNRCHNEIGRIEDRL